MNSSNEVRPGSLVCEPTASALIEWRQAYPEDSGKFIRVGGLVVLGPGFPDPLRHEPLKHLDILWAAFQGQDETLRARIGKASENTEEPVIRDNGNLVDAGHYTSRIDSTGGLTALLIWGDSYDFGRADDKGRQQTIDLIQAKLAPIAVRAAD